MQSMVGLELAIVNLTFGNTDIKMIVISNKKRACYWYI